ncbi:hypothetical protein [Streptomyces sp. WMMC905]|uniref:hypothetical protein n=1 Tax=Streptomyces sp. WMMC905 TaxID=3404123 RepID=UPI003B93EB56
MRGDLIDRLTISAGTLTEESGGAIPSPGSLPVTLATPLAISAALCPGHVIAVTVVGGLAVDYAVNG